MEYDPYMDIHSEEYKNWMETLDKLLKRIQAIKAIKNTKKEFMIKTWNSIKNIH